MKLLNFEFVVTKEEDLCLVRIRQCKALNDFNALKVAPFMEQEVSPNIGYIRSAIHQMYVQFSVIFRMKSVLSNRGENG